VPPADATATAPAPDGVLVRFGEIGIKSAPVRRAMAERLRRNLLAQMQRGSVEGDVVRLGSRLWAVGPDANALVDVACRTFGVVSASPARRVPATLEAILPAAVGEALGKPWRTFAVRARREGTHPFSSQDIQVQAGSAIWKAAEAAGRPVKVDLTRPDLEVDVDVRQDQAFVFSATREGPGGIPMGSQGRVAVLLSDANSALAAWLMARRGCDVLLLHAGTALSVPSDPLAALARWGLPPTADLLPPPESKEALLLLATEAATRRHAEAVVTGETLSSRLVGAPIPILRPVCGLDAAEASRWMERAGLDAGRSTTARGAPAVAA